MKRTRLEMLYRTGGLAFADAPDEAVEGAAPAVESEDAVSEVKDSPAEKAVEAPKPAPPKVADVESEPEEDAEDEEKGAGSKRAILADLSRERLARQAAEAKIKDYEDRERLRETRATVLSTKNVPSEWADFVTGSTEDEMNAAADRILKNLGGVEGPALHPTRGKSGGSLEAGREAAKNFR